MALRQVDIHPHTHRLSSPKDRDPIARCLPKLRGSHAVSICPPRLQHRLPAFAWAARCAVFLTSAAVVVDVVDKRRRWGGEGGRTWREIDKTCGRRKARARWNGLRSCNSWFGHELQKSREKLNMKEKLIARSSAYCRSSQMKTEARALKRSGHSVWCETKWRGDRFAAAICESERSGIQKESLPSAWQITSVYDTDVRSHRWSVLFGAQCLQFQRCSFVGFKQCVWADHYFQKLDIIACSFEVVHKFRDNPVHEDRPSSNNEDGLRQGNPVRENNLSKGYFLEIF